MLCSSLVEEIDVSHSHHQNLLVHTVIAQLLAICYNDKERMSNK